MSNFFAKALIASYRVDEECHDSADGSDFAEQQPMEGRPEGSQEGCQARPGGPR